MKVKLTDMSTKHDVEVCWSYYPNWCSSFNDMGISTGGLAWFIKWKIEQL